MHVHVHSLIMPTRTSSACAAVFTDFREKTMLSRPLQVILFSMRCYSGANLLVNSLKSPISVEESIFWPHPSIQNTHAMQTVTIAKSFSQARGVKPSRRAARVERTIKNSPMRCVSRKKTPGMGVKTHQGRDLHMCGYTPPPPVSLSVRTFVSIFSILVLVSLSELVQKRRSCVSREK